MEIQNNHSIGKIILDMFTKVIGVFVFGLVISLIGFFSMVIGNPENTTKAIVFSIILIMIYTLGIALARILGKKKYQTIINPIKEMDAVAMELSQGNFEIKISYQSENEIGALADSFRQMKERFGLVIKDIDMLLQKFTQGEFDAHSECREAYVGDLQNILVHLKNMTKAISASLLMVQESSDQVTKGSEQLAESAQGLAQWH